MVCAGYEINNLSRICHSRNESIVQTQLAREDIARVEKLCALAETHDNYAAKEKDGPYIGWTKGDFRTHELSDPLKALMHAIFDSTKTTDLDQIIDVSDDLSLGMVTAKYTLAAALIV